MPWFASSRSEREGRLMFNDKELLNPMLKERLESSASMALSLMRSTALDWDWQPVTRGPVLENAQTWTTAEIIFEAWSEIAKRESDDYHFGLYTYAAVLREFVTKAYDTGLVGSGFAKGRLSVAKMYARETARVADRRATNG